MALSKAQMRKIVLSFPGATESTSYGHPSFKIEKKFFTRLRAEDNSMVLIVDSMDERDMLLEAGSDCFISPTIIRIIHPCWHGWSIWMRRSCGDSSNGDGGGLRRRNC